MMSPRRSGVTTIDEQESYDCPLGVNEIGGMIR